MEEADDFRRRLVPGADLRGVTFPSFDNLDGVDLHGADLRGADLRKVNWWDEGEVQLSNTDFSGADLRGAWLGAPIFDGANLDGAVLISCTLRNASLVGTSLIGANLQGSTLTAADLRGANPTSAALPSGLSAFAGARFDASTQWREEMRAKAEANSVAGPDCTHVINSPPPPPPTPAPTTPPAQQSARIGKVVGRVAAVLFGAGLTIYAVLYLTGHVGTLGRVLEAKTDVLDDALVGMLFTVGAMSLLCGIFGLPEESRSSSRRSRGDTGFDGDSCGCGVEVGRGVGVRDSKAPSVRLPLTAHQWTQLLRMAKAG